MLNNFCVFEELVFFDLRILDSRFRFPIPESGFRFPGFGVALYYDQYVIDINKIKLRKLRLSVQLFFRAT